MLKKWCEKKINRVFGGLTLVLLMVIGIINVTPARAINGDPADWTITDRFGVSMRLMSVEDNGVEIEPEWTEYLFNWDIYGFGDYYFPVTNTADKLRVGILIDGIPEGVSYFAFNEIEVTSEDNGSIIYKEIKPHVFDYEMQDSSYQGAVTPLANEYIIDYNLQRSDYTSNLLRSMVIRPANVGSRDIEINSVIQGGVNLYVDTVGRQASNYEDMDATLQTINEYKIADYHNPAEITFTFKNLEMGQNYTFSAGGQSGLFEADSTEKTFTYEIPLDFTKKHSNITVSLYGPGEHDESDDVTLYFRIDTEDFGELPQTVTFGDCVDPANIVQKTYGDDNFICSATSDGDGTITYTSSNENAATVNPETGEVTIVGAGESTITAVASSTEAYAEGSAEYVLEIAAKAVSIVSVAAEDKVYDGTTVAVGIDAVVDDDTLVLGTDYHIVDAYFPSSDVGTYDSVIVVVELDANVTDRYTFAFCGYNNRCGITTSASIAPLELTTSNAQAELDQTEFYYSGDAYTPGATVRVSLDGDSYHETVIEYGDDYTINYSNNIDAGPVYATIIGQGNFSGELPELLFYIYPAQVSDVEVTIPAQTYTGTAYTPVVTVTGVVYGERITIDPANYILDDNTYTEAGDYVINVGVNVDANYYVESTAGIFTINKAESGNPPEMEAHLRIESGKTLSELPEGTIGFFWDDVSAIVTEGEGSYAATYIKDNDNKNYLESSVMVPVYGIKRINITTAGMNGGTTSGPGATALEGDELTFTFAPDEGCRLISVFVNDTERTEDVLDSQLTILAGTDDIAVISYYSCSYEVVVGNAQTHIRGVDGAAEFEINAEYSLFEGTGEVYIDGDLLDEKNYESRSGSTIISLKPEYLDTLASGEHSMEVKFNDGIARTTFTIIDPVAPEEDVPAAANTGTFTGTANGAVVASTSVATIIVLASAMILSKRIRKTN